jgi:signal peptidase
LAERHRRLRREGLPRVRRVRHVIDAALLVLALAALAGGTAVFLLHLQLRPVLSGSMRPSIQPGDLAIVRPVPASSLEVGDVVVYYPPDYGPGRDAPALMHRITSLARQADGLWITTRGDANGADDPWGRVRLRGDTAYRLLTVVPMVGYLPVWSQGLRGPVLIVAGLLLALTAVTSVRRKPSTARPMGAAGRRSLT